MKRIKLKIEKVSDGTIVVKHTTSKLNSVALYNDIYNNIEGVIRVAQGNDGYAFYIHKANELFNFNIDIIPEVMRLIVQQLPNDYFVVIRQPNIIVDSSNYKNVILESEL